MDNATEALLSTQASDTSDDLRLLVSAGLEAFARFRLKIALEKGPNLVSGTNVYGEKLDPDVYEEIMSTYLDSELERGTILVLIRELGAMTTKDLAEKTNIPQDRILQHLLRMKRDELLTLAGESHGYILYDVPRTPSDEEVVIETVSTIALQLAEAKSGLKSILADFKAEDIGNLANAFETFSKGRDKLAKIAIAGTLVGEPILTGVEDTIKSAVSLAYRTRARIPSTRPKVTLDDLMDVDVPSVLDEYRSMMGYAPLLGFGTVEWDHSKCLGCKSCEISCPEDAIKLKPLIQTSDLFEFSEDALEKLPINRALFYRTVRNLAAKKPVADIVLDKESPGFGTVAVDLWLCVACRTCVRRCPGPESGALELNLKWSLPEVVRQITAQD
ncbi:MAG: 4Fe-4S dicluster domain-containing protein, partial [Candidatus Thorarchaeota archaeon]